MKILEKKDFSNWRQQITCQTCETKLEIEPGDVHGHYTESWGDPRDGASGGDYWTYTASCPVCNSTLYVDGKTMPKAMLHEVQTKRKRK